DDEFDILCFSFGIELDGIRSRISTIKADGNSQKLIIHKDVIDQLVLPIRPYCVCASLYEIKLDQNHPNLKQFVHIIEKSPLFPVIIDSKGTILSMPPIINSYHSRLTLATRNIFIECTATDLVKANIVLNAIVTCFSRYCAKPNTIGPVEIINPDKKSTIYPELVVHNFHVSTIWLNKNIGIDVSRETHCLNLNRMGLDCSFDSCGDSIHVTVPPNRPDIIHKFDILEDAAIAFGFNNIPRCFPHISTTASMASLNDMTTRLNLNDSSIDSSLLPVKIDSPYEHNCVRNSLIPGILKTISSNRKLALPIKIFEVSDIVIRDSSKANKAVNQRNLCAIYCAASSGFEFIHGVLDKIMSSVEINASFVSSTIPMYFPLRSCEVVVNKTVIGHMGILHPIVSKNFEIHQAVCSALEINVEKLLKFYEE
ncbi:hypothetical protein MXB_3270, partial [Myxobolus squamalis]